MYYKIQVWWSCIENLLQSRVIFINGMVPNNLKNNLKPIGCWRRVGWAKTFAFEYGKRQRKRETTRSDSWVLFKIMKGCMCQ